MQATRRARLQAEIQQKLSVLISREIKDPRVPAITITQVEVTPDASQATVSIAILGGAQGGHDGAPPLSEQGAKMRMKDCLDGLASAAGFLRRNLARSIEVRHIPTLLFREDRGIENVSRVHELLKEIEGSKHGGGSGDNGNTGS
jgi:ribosome-binding factor A